MFFCSADPASAAQAADAAAKAGEAGGHGATAAARSRRTHTPAVVEAVNHYVGPPLTTSRCTTRSRSGTASREVRHDRRQGVRRQPLHARQTPCRGKR